MIKRRDLGETAHSENIAPRNPREAAIVVAGPNGVITVDTETVSQIADVMEEIETDLMIADLA